MKKQVLFLLLLAAMTPWATQAQNTFTIGEDATYVTYDQSPYGGKYQFSYHAYLYDASTVNFTGTINSIAFNCTEASEANERAVYTIYMADVESSYTLEASNSFSDYRSDAGSWPVLEETMIPALAQGWNTITLDKLVDHHSGNSILIVVEAWGCTSTGGCPKPVYHTFRSNRTWYCNSNQVGGWILSGELASQLPAVKFIYRDCTAITEYPYTVDFEYAYDSQIVPFLPLCWSSINPNTTLLTTEYPTLHDTSTPNGEILLLRLTEDDIENEYVIMPEMENLHNKRIKLYCAGFRNGNYSPDPTFYVGIMTDPTDASTFTRMARCKPTSTEDFEQFIIPFDTYSGTGRYIAFMLEAMEMEQYVCIDDITVENNCDAPEIYDFVSYSNRILVNWEGGSGTYNVEYKEASATEWISRLTNYHGGGCIINDLEEATTYQVRLQSICDDVTSEWITEEFTTACSSFSLPYYYDFGNEAEMNCWSIVNSYGGINEYDGNHFFTFGPTPTPPHYLISPEFSGSTAMLMSFHYMCPNYPQTIQVGYSTTINTIDAFTWGDEITLNDLDTWRLYEEEFPVGTKYIAIKHLSEWYLYLDDFSFEVPASCNTPTNLTLNYHSQENQIWVNWDSDATLWNLNVNGSVFNVSNRPFVLSSNISQLTDYEVRVRTECEGYTHSPWSEPADFSCRYTIMEMEPFTEGFEGYTGTTYSAAGVIPYCWDSDSEGSISPHIISSGSYCYVHNGSNTLYFYGAAQTNSYLALRPFTNRLSDLKVSFWMQTESTPGTLSLGYITADDVNYNTYTVIEEYENHSGSMVEHTTYLPDVPEEAVRLVFRWAYDGTSWYGCCIDDISVELLPFCETLDELSYDAETLTDSSVELSWTLIDEYQTQWDVQYATDEWFTENVVMLQGVDSYENYLLSGLQAMTHYYVRVRANCGQSFSMWSNTVDFETLHFCLTTAEAIDVDNLTAVSAEVSWEGQSDSYNIRYRTAAIVSNPVFSEDFDSVTSAYTAPDGWMRYKGLVDQVMAGSTSLTQQNYPNWTFTKANVFESYHATVYLWNTQMYWLVSPEITLTAGNALNFDLALTDTDNTSAIEDPSGQADDRFVVLISTDDGATWNILREWNNSGSEYVFNTIATTGEPVSIDLSAYNGTVKLAFYAESTVSNGDTKLHIDNVTVAPTIAASPWQYTAALNSPHTLLGLAADTEYEVQVQGVCYGTAGETWSNLINFTTPSLSQITKEITGYNNGGSWYLIAPPFSGLNPADIEGMTTSDYDLYRFNPSAVDQEWRNYEITPFGLTVGKGYLYAHDEDVTLTFTGTPYEGTEPVEVSLVYDATNERKCWNLVGNPFDCEATLDRSYYTLKADGTGINPEAVSAGTPIPPCTAVFVKAVAAGDKVVFSKVGR